MMGNSSWMGEGADRWYIQRWVGDMLARLVLGWRVGFPFSLSDFRAARTNTLPRTYELQESGNWSSFASEEEGTR